MLEFSILHAYITLESVVKYFHIYYKISDHKNVNVVILIQKGICRKYIDDRNRIQFHCIISGSNSVTHHE